MLIDTSKVSLQIWCSSFVELASHPTSPAVSNIRTFCRSRTNSSCDSVDLDSPTYCAQVESLESISNPKPLRLPSLYDNATTPNSIPLKFAVLPHNHVVVDNELDTILYVKYLRKNRDHLVDDDARSLSLSMRTTASSSATSTRTLRRLPGRIFGQIENNNLSIEGVARDCGASKKNPILRQKLNVSADSQIITPFAVLVLLPFPLLLPFRRRQTLNSNGTGSTIRRRSIYHSSTELFSPKTTSRRLSSANLSLDQPPTPTRHRKVIHRSGLESAKFSVYSQKYQLANLFFPYCDADWKWRKKTTWQDKEGTIRSLRGQLLTSDLLLRVQKPGNWEHLSARTMSPVSSLKDRISKSLLVYTSNFSSMPNLINK